METSSQEAPSTLLSIAISTLAGPQFKILIKLGNLKVTFFFFFFPQRGRGKTDTGGGHSNFSMSCTQHRHAQPPSLSQEGLGRAGPALPRLPVVLEHPRRLASSRIPTLPSSFCFHPTYLHCFLLLNFPPITGSNNQAA